MDQIKYGSLTVMAERGADYLCKCNICNQQGVYNKYALKNGTIKNCRVCKKFRGIEIGRLNAKGLEVKGYRSNQQDGDKVDVLAKCSKCEYIGYMTKEEFTGDKACPTCRSGGKKISQSTIDKKFGKGTKIVYTGNNVDEHKLQKGAVDKENKIIPKSYSEHMKLIEKAEAKILADKGILKKNHIGEVYNGMIIVSQETEGKKYRCKVKCTYCEAEYIVDLSSVLSYKFKCGNCKEVKYTFACPSCKKVSVRTTSRIGGAYSDDRALFTVTREELYSGGVLQCHKCNSQINLATNAYDTDMTERRKAIISCVDTSKFGNFEKIDANTGLIISKEAAYRGRDGEFRYNCYCMEHKKHLCLTAEQTVGYEHDLCNDNDNMKSVPL